MNALLQRSLRILSQLRKIYVVGVIFHHHRRACEHPAVCSGGIRTHLLDSFAHFNRILHKQVPQTVHANLAATLRAGAVVLQGQIEVYFHPHAGLVAGAEGVKGVCFATSCCLLEQVESLSFAGIQFSF